MRTLSHIGRLRRLLLLAGLCGFLNCVAFAQEPEPEQPEQPEQPSAPGDTAAAQDDAAADTPAADADANEADANAPSDADADASPAPDPSAPAAAPGGSPAAAPVNPGAGRPGGGGRFQGGGGGVGPRAFGQAAAPDATRAGGPGGDDGEPVTLQIPLGSVAEVLPLYEQLTGKVVIKDSSIYGGPEVSLVTPNEVSRVEAIRLIEATLIINGYVVIHDEESNTVKIMLARAANQAATNFNEGEILYTDPNELPLGEALIGYYMALDFIAPEDAGTIMTNHVQLNPYGRITPVSTPPGLLITETANIIRKLIKLKTIIDVAPDQARLMTEFVQVTYADSNTVAQIIQAAMDARYEESQRIAELGRTISGNQPQQPQQQQRPGQPQQPQRSNNSNQNNNQQGDALGTANDPAPQLIADDRLNRIMVQASPSDFAFILNLIQEFDQPTPNDDPLERPLRYVKVADILPTVVDLLMDTGTGQTQLPGGRTLNTQQTPVASSQLTALTGLQQESQQSRFIQNQDGATEDGQPADQL
ncbi:MAG: secretin N-terminal domain-containing protein [Verrucomicrobiota bacterium]